MIIGLSSWDNQLDIYWVNNKRVQILIVFILTTIIKLRFLKQLWCDRNYILVYKRLGFFWYFIGILVSMEWIDILTAIRMVQVRTCHYYSFNAKTSLKFCSSITIDFYCLNTNILRNRNHAFAWFSVTVCHKSFICKSISSNERML